MIEIIGKEIEIYKVKLLLFMTIAGGSWVYALKLLPIPYKAVLVLIFALSSFGVFLNVSKLGHLQKELKRLKND